jgi:hypothetical protein
VPAPRTSITLTVAESEGGLEAAHFDAPASGAFGFPGPMGEPTDGANLDEDAHIRSVFAEYVAARGRCGESIASLTLEKFRAKLEANKQQLIAKYGCRTARFSVYVKDGKAAIKATPVR